MQRVHSLADREAFASVWPLDLSNIATWLFDGSTALVVANRVLDHDGIAPLACCLEEEAGDEELRCDLVVEIAVRVTRWNRLGKVGQHESHNGGCAASSNR